MRDVARKKESKSNGVVHTGGKSGGLHPFLDPLQLFYSQVIFSTKIQYIVDHCITDWPVILNCNEFCIKFHIECRTGYTKFSVRIRVKSGREHVYIYIFRLLFYSEPNFMLF